jgi:hypothetical protein
VKKEKHWTVHEYHFHILHSLLPSLLRQPPERNIRIISLVSPTISAALPTLLGKPAKNDKAQIAGAKGITTLLFGRHFQLILDTLAAAALKKVKEVPTVEGDGVMKKKEEGVGSNIMDLNVIMPWTRDEILRGLWGAQGSWLWGVLCVISAPGKGIADAQMGLVLSLAPDFHPFAAPRNPVDHLCVTSPRQVRSARAHRARPGGPRVVSERGGEWGHCSGLRGQPVSCSVSSSDRELTSDLPRFFQTTV